MGRATLCFFVHLGCHVLRASPASIACDRCITALRLLLMLLSRTHLQLISPHDKGVWQGILANLAPWDKALYESTTVATVRANPLCRDPTPEQLPAYIKRAGEGYCRHRDVNASTRPSA